MRKSGIYGEGDVAIGRSSNKFQSKESAENRTKGIVFQGWKRYEEAEEEE